MKHRWISTSLSLVVAGALGTALFLRDNSVAQIQNLPATVATAPIISNAVEYISPVNSFQSITWSSDELAAMPRAVVVVAGTTLPFRWAHYVGGGGTWSADWGTINSNGDYTAPAFLPPFGTDTISYHRSDGFTELIELRIVPNPNINNSDKTAIKRVYWRSDGQAGTTANPVNNVSISHEGKFVPLATDEELPLLPQLADQLTPNITSYSATLVQHVPVKGFENLLDVSPIVVVYDSNNPVQVARVVPILSDSTIAMRYATEQDAPCSSEIETNNANSLSGNLVSAPKCKCKNAQITYDIQKVSLKEKRGPTVVTLGIVTAANTGTINANLAQAIGGSYSITISGSMNLLDRQWYYMYEQKRHKYQCRNGKPTYIGTDIRSKTDTHHFYTPWWAWAFDWSAGQLHTVPNQPELVEYGYWTDWTGA